MITINNTYVIQQQKFKKARIFNKIKNFFTNDLKNTPNSKGRKT